MKSPYFVDFSWDLVDFSTNLSRTLADVHSTDFRRDFESKTRELFDKIKVAERTHNREILSALLVPTFCVPTFCAGCFWNRQFQPSRVLLTKSHKSLWELIFGKGMRTATFQFQSLAVHRMGRTSSLSCLSCRIPHQTLHSLNAPPLFAENPFSGPEKRVVTKGVFALKESLESRKSPDSLESGRVRRRPPDYSSNLCPPKTWSIWLF